LSGGDPLVCLAGLGHTPLVNSRRGPLQIPAIEVPPIPERLEIRQARFQEKERERSISSVVRRSALRYALLPT
jgi:hypothetical protein